MSHWKRASERALAFDVDRAADQRRHEILTKVRDALWHSADDKELRERLQKILDDLKD